MKSLYQIYKIGNTLINFLVIMKATQLKHLRIYTKHYTVHLLLLV